jgi:hypothetical protein
MNIDAHGFIVQADGDGGDTAQRMGMYWAGFLLNAARVTTTLPKLPTLTLDKLSSYMRHGFVRHPFQDGFRSDPAHFSRDQQDPLVVMMGLLDIDDYLRWTLKNQLKRSGRYQNRDWANLNTVSLYIRAFKARHLWPLLLVTDLGLIVSGISHWVKRKRDPIHTDINNHVIRLAQAQAILPTLTSWLARKLFKRLWPDMNEALAFYHRAENGGNPEMAELYRPIIVRF